MQGGVIKERIYQRTRLGMKRKVMMASTASSATTRSTAPGWIEFEAETNAEGQQELIAMYEIARRSITNGSSG